MSDHVSFTSYEQTEEYIKSVIESHLRGFEDLDITGCVPIQFGASDYRAQFALRTVLKDPLNPPFEFKSHLKFSVAYVTHPHVILSALSAMKTSHSIGRGVGRELARSSILAHFNSIIDQTK